MPTKYIELFQQIAYKGPSGRLKKKHFCRIFFVRPTFVYKKGKRGLVKMEVGDEHLSMAQDNFTAVRGDIYRQDRRFCIIGMWAGIFGL